MWGVVQDRARDQAEMADDLHKSVKGQVQERLKTINDLKEKVRVADA